MTPPYAIERYRRACVDTADPRAAVTYLYDAAIRSLRQALKAIETFRVAERGAHLDRALTAVIELAGALDMEAGGSLAAQLDGIYTFLAREIVASNAEIDAERLEGCVAVLRVLREAWEHVAVGRNPVGTDIEDRVALSA